MESINLLVLSGTINQDATVLDSSQTAFFELCTFYCVGRGKEKKRFKEIHQVEFHNPGTILKFLKAGKPVTIQGRVKPEGGVLAMKVHFPSSRNHDE